MPHVRGYPVHYTTYNNQRCRCAGCTEAKRDWQRDYHRRTGYREARTQQRAALAALRWVKTHNPILYRAIYDQARRQTDAAMRAEP